LGYVRKINSEQGNSPEAQKALRDSLAIRERLAKGDPANVNTRPNFGVSNVKLGLLLEAAGDKTNAYSFFSEALVQFDAVVKIAPDWAEARRMAGAAAQLAERLRGA
jgi:hypothetical protein